MRKFSIMSALVLGLAAASVASADGALRLAIQNEMGFQVFQLYEIDGRAEGRLTSVSGTAPISAWHEGDYFKFSYGNQKFELLKDVRGESATSYRGFFFDHTMAKFDTFYVAKKTLMKITGQVGNTRFDANMNLKKGRTALYWKNFSMEIKRDRSEKGACTGELRLGTEKRAQMTCSSSGSFEDLLFKSSEHLAAWILNFFVFDSEDQDPE